MQQHPSSDYIGPDTGSELERAPDAGVQAGDDTVDDDAERRGKLSRVDDGLRLGCIDDVDGGADDGNRCLSLLYAGLGSVERFNTLNDAGQK